MDENRKRKWFVTVEPTFVLFNLASMLTSVVQDAFFVDKACRITHSSITNATICDNINEKRYEDIMKKVQITVSDFNLLNDVTCHSIQIILALFMGAWSDKRGRKLPLLLGLTGKLYFYAMMIVNARQDSWSLNYIVYTASIPSALTGAELAIYSSVYSYIVDVSSEKDRTMRQTILEIGYVAASPIGTALGSYLFQNVTNKSFPTMFGITCALFLTAILYSLFMLEWQTNDRQRSITEANNIFLDFFDFKHLFNTFKTLFKWRPNGQRKFLLILLPVIPLYMFLIREIHFMYMYLQLVFNWTFDHFSTFKTVIYSVEVAILLVATTIMSRLFHWRDTIIGMIGISSYLIARILFANASEDWMIYLGGIFMAFGSILPPVIRSTLSKLVSPMEKGKIFSLHSSLSQVAQMISGICYSRLYKATIHNNPGSFFYLTVGTGTTSFLLLSYIVFTTKDGDLIHKEGPKENKPISEIEEKQKDLMK